MGGKGCLCRRVDSGDWQGVADGQGDGEGGSGGFGVCYAANFNGATVAFDDFFCDPETEASADVFFGGEEWLEDAIAMFCCDAGAVVFNGDSDDLARWFVVVSGVFVAGDFDANDAVIGDGVGGVGDEVGDGLLEFAGEAVDGGTVFEVALDGDVLGAEFVGVDVEDRFDEGGKIDFVGEFGFAIEAEGLAGDVGDAIELLLGEGEMRDGGVGDAFGGPGDEDEVADGFERVVDLVGDGGGETSGGGEFFGFAEDLLGLTLVGGVAEDHDDAD